MLISVELTLLGGGKEMFGGMIDEASVNRLLHVIDLTDVQNINIVRKP